MQDVLDELAALRGKPLEALTALRWRGNNRLRRPGPQEGCWLRKGGQGRTAPRWRSG